MNQSVTLVYVMLLGSLVISEVTADEVLLTNGDRYTGTLVGADNRSIEFQSQYQTVLRIPYAHVNKLVSCTPVMMELATGERLMVSGFTLENGRVVLKSKGLGTITVVDSTVKSVCLLPETEVRDAGLTQSAMSLLRGKKSGASTKSHDDKDSKSPESPPTIGQKPEEEDIRRLFLRRESVLLRPREFDLEGGLNYQVDEVRIPGLQNRRQREFTVPLSARIGVMERIEAFATLPLMYGTLENNNFGDVQNNSEFGLGDLSAGAKFLCFSESPPWPETVLSLGFIAPTGSKPTDMDQIALGSGHWAVSGGVQFIKTLDPVVIFWGLSYSHLFAAKRYYSAPDQDVQPGELFGYNLGLAFAINDNVSVSALVLGYYFSEDKIDGVTISGSSRDTVSLRLALTHRVNRNTYVEPSLSFGLTTEAPDMGVGITLTHRFGKP